MPEGPEIRRTADQLAAAVVGEPLQAVWFAREDLARRAPALVGRRITSITPRGKALLTAFDNGLTLYSHNQLYGVWKLAASGSRPSTSRSLRVALETSRKAILLYSASDLELGPDAAIRALPQLARLGPDVLDPALDAGTVAGRLRHSRFAGRSLAALLLDQGFLAGMGNYLRSEVLFRAGVAPERRPRELDDHAIAALAVALLDVPRSSYRTRGIRRSRGMKAEYSGDGPDRFRFRVFDRAGEPCEACGQPLERIEASGRRLYLCRRCQG